MKIKQLHLENYGRFEDLKIDFAPTEGKKGNVTVIVGNNGAGKSQILQALATSLSWFVVRLKNDKAEGEYQTQSIIKNNSDRSIITVALEDIVFRQNNGEWYKDSVTAKWSIYALNAKILISEKYSFNMHHFHFIIDSYRYLVDKNEKASLPLLAYYSTERNVVIEPIHPSYSFTVNQTIAYQNALDATIDYNILFQWFRDNEDIENELTNTLLKRDEKRVESLTVEHKLIELKSKKEQLEEIGEDIFTNEEVYHQKLAELCAEIERLRSRDNALMIRSSFMHEVIEQKKFSSLNSVRQAIEYFTGFKNPRIRRQGTPTMIVEKDGEELDVNQLSQGEKSLLALVGDIARRLAILNPSLDDPLKGEGVVMIDEVDLHLHPKWQHDLIDKLVKTFPNVQFILTTHSPHIVSDRNDILIYSLDNGELEEVDNVYGQDANTVLTKVFNVDPRKSEVEDDFNDIRRAISHKDYETAEKGIQSLAEKMPADDLELLKCRLMLAQAKVNDRDNNELVHADD